MPTIKRKVEMNLPQFIAWAVDNHITGSFYANNRVNAKRIRFEFGRIVSSHGELRSHDTFTVEIEEVVDSNTVLDNVYTVNVEEGTSHTTYYKSKSINEVKTDEINIIYTILQEEAIVLWDSQGGFR